MTRIDFVKELVSYLKDTPYTIILRNDTLQIAFEDVNINCIGDCVDVSYKDGTTLKLGDKPYYNFYSKYFTMRSRDGTTELCIV